MSAGAIAVAAIAVARMNFFMETFGPPKGGHYLLAKRGHYRAAGDASGAAPGSPAGDPANTRLPLASVTLRALAIFEPSFAADPLTVISSPIFNELRVQPWRTRTFG